MTGFAEAIKNVLVSAGVGTFGTDIFIGNVPNSPNSLIVIMETGGSPIDTEMYMATERPTFQVFVRNTSYQTGKAKLSAVRAALHRKLNFTENGVYFYSIFASSEGGQIGRDDQGRDEFSINFEAFIR